MAAPVWAGELARDDPAVAAPFLGAKVVILGEIHDNPLHHARQVRIVAALTPKALVFEMLEPQHAEAISPDLRKDAVQLAQAIDWDARGWPDFAMYYPIFAAAPGTPIFGGGMDRADVRKAIALGAATAFGEDAGMFGLDARLSPDEQKARQSLQQIAHCNALPDSLLPGMVEAQRVRDAALAKAIVAALAEDGDGPVILIAGNGHAREDWGVPRGLRAYFARTNRSFDIVSLAQYEETAPDDPPFTHWIVTPKAARNDPCAAFED